MPWWSGQEATDSKRCLGGSGVALVVAAVTFALGGRRLRRRHETPTPRATGQPPGDVAAAMAVNPATTNKDGERSALGELQVIAGLLAGLAAMVYVTGGAALGLRLLWAGLPTLPVGQLPRDFLFSLGAAQIVLPALVIAIVAGMLELGQSLRGLKYGHRQWSAVKRVRRVRRAYLAFYGAVPAVVMTPGLVIALATDDELADTTDVLAVVIGVAIVLLVVWIGFARAARLSNRTTPASTGMHNLRALAWTVVLAPGLLFSVAIGLWMWKETDSPRYLALAGGWLISLFFALLTVWVRSQAGKLARRRSPILDDDPGRVPRERADDPPIEVPPWVVVLSWLGTALLAVPALIAVTAAWPLSNAAACAERVGDKPYIAAGKFVGDTKDRVFIGDVDNRRLIAVPAGRVSRMLVGRHGVGRAACRTRADG